MIRLFSTSDAQLVRQTLAGKRDAFGSLVERYQPVAYAVAYARVNLHADAEDVAQEALLAAYQQLDTLRDPGRFGAWLAGIARHCASRVRERRLRDATMAERQNGEEPVVMPDHERRELWELIRAEIDRLNELDREVVLLHYFAGKSSREIASVTDATSEAVRKRLQRARETLGSRLLERAAVPAQPDRKKTQHIMGLIAAAPAAWEAAGQVGAGAVSLTGGITMSKVVGFVAVIAALAGGAYVVYRTASAPPVPARGERIEMATETRTTAAEPASHGSILPSPDAEESNPQQNAAGTEWTYPVEVQGIVYDIHKEPAANVPVNIQLVRFARELNGMRASETPLEQKTVRTDEHGYVLARFDTAASRYDGIVAEWRISPPGAYCYSRTVAVPNTRRAAWPLFTLPTQTIVGTVRDADGNPVVGARVRPVRFEGPASNSPYAPMPDDAGTVTGADGTFTLSQLYVGRWKFLVQAKGHGATVSDFVQTGTSADITLPPALTLAGTANDESTGEPIAGLVLALQREDEFLDSYRVTTDSNGSYRFDSLVRGTYRLLTDDSYRFIPEAILQVTKSRTNYTIELEPGAVVTGRVLDADTGQPIPGVVAMAGPTEQNDAANLRASMRSQPTGADGVYRVSGLPDGSYLVGFSNPVQLPGGKREPLNVGKLKAGRVYDGNDYVVERRYPVSGIVRDKAGQPLEGVNIIYPLAAQDFLSYGNGATGPDGRFTFWLAGPSENLVLAGTSGSWATPEYGPISVQTGGVGGIELTAYPAGRIFGMVKGPDGALVQSVPVTYEATRSTAMRDAPASERQILGADQVWAHDGRFRLVGLPPGDYTFTYGGVSRTVSLGPGEAVSDLVIQAMPEGSATVQGTTYVAGQATAGVSVEFSDDAGYDPPAAVSSEDGVYRLAGIPGGSLQYSAFLHGFDRGLEITRYQQGAVDVPAKGISTFDIAFAQSTSVIEGVVTENGEPKRRAQLAVGMAWDETTSESVMVMTDEAGFYRITGLPAGDHELALDLRPSVPNDGPHSHRYFYTVSTADGQTTRHDVHLDMGSVSVTYSGIGAGEQGHMVLIPDVADVEELTLLKASSLIDRAVYDAEVETDGSVTIEDVPAGTQTVLFAIYDANVESDEERFATARYTSSVVEVVQGKEASVTFSLPE
ncbi:MAG: sigma-70 family RNA polymerase sigma factor [Candidatus Hydrogenedentes bacterium]|nr:sigma-70 family RNA polymerase sigma factor [Candidatus Hydrogenedentota bacterium]